MAEAHFTVDVQTSTLRRVDGLIFGLRLQAPKIIDAWFWVNREADRIEELRPYRVGMFKGAR